MDSGYWEMVKNAIAENREIVKQNREEAKAIKKANGEPVSLLDKVKSTQLFHYNGAYDDQIEIRTGTKTLLGDDFESLYENSTTASVKSKDIDGSEASIDIIRSKCSYQTEMHTGDLRSAQWSEYETLPVDKKAAYEVTLLTKKYANMPESEENAKTYADTMARYRQYCDFNNVSWDNLIHTVSSELQTEVSDYMTLDANKGDLYDQVSLSSKKAKAQAADAHNLLLTCAPEGYEDTLAPGLNANVSYEDTCDSRYDGSVFARTAGFFTVVHTMFMAIYDKLPHPIEWAKDAFHNLKEEGRAFAENTQALVEDFEERSDAHVQEFHELEDQMQGIQSDIDSTKAGQAINGAEDAVKDEIQQIFDDPSQEVQDARDWIDEKVEQAEPYFDAAGNTVNAAGDTVKNKADEFVNEWADPDIATDNPEEDYLP